MEDRQERKGKGDGGAGTSERKRRECRDAGRRRGRLAEMRVARLLNRLPRDRFRVLHNLRYCWGDIDHVVVRRDGIVFVIETKGHVGRVGWDGRRLLLNGRPLRENWIGQVMASMRWLRRLVRLFWGSGAPIRGVVVIPNGRVEFHGPARGIQIVETLQLLALLGSQ